MAGKPYLGQMGSLGRWVTEEAGCAAVVVPETALHDELSCTIKSSNCLIQIRTNWGGGQ